MLEGLDEILTLVRLGLPLELRRSLACTNSIENMNGTIRRVCANVQNWQDASVAQRWTGAGMIEAAKIPKAQSPQAIAEPVRHSGRSPG
jgi:putative transposase